MKRITITLVFLLLTSYETLAGNIWSSLGVITDVQVIHHGGFIVGFENPFDLNCPGDGDRSYIYIDKNGVTEGGAAALLATALLGLSTGIPAKVQYDDSDVSCWGRYLKLER